MSFIPKFNPWTRKFQWVVDMASAVVDWVDITNKPAAITGTEEAFTTVF